MQTLSTHAISSSSSAATAWRSSSSGSSSSRATGLLPRQRSFRRAAAGSSSRLRVAAQQSAEQQGSSMVRSASAELDTQAPYLEPFLRTFVLGVGAGMLLEGGHVALQVLSGTFPGMSGFSPLYYADHVTALAAWLALFAVEAAAIASVLKRFNNDRRAAAPTLNSLVTLPRKMMPMRLKLFKRFFLAGTKMALSRASAAGKAEAPTVLEASTASSADCAHTTSAPTGGRAPSASPTRPPTKAPGANTVLPLPKGRLTSPERDIKPKPTPTPTPGPENEREQDASVAKRSKELSDREGYLRNMWYAAALSERVGKEPVETQLCGRQMVLFRDEHGKVHCIDNACPHRGAPLSQGWVQHRGKEGGGSCITCPYHGWAMDGEGVLQDVPAASNKGEWPKRPLVDSWPVEEKGGFIWLFYGSKDLPAEERPPIPYVPELDDPTWRPVYEEIEFDCNHFGVFENAIDMAHIHYLHGDSFGNQGKPEIRDMTASSDAFSVTANFTVHNKPVNAFWALFQVPEVHVTARAFLPCTSLVTFELANGLNFTTFVSTAPISANKTVNRFALVRKLSSDPVGLFNLPLWDGMARNAMLNIQREDKDMVERLRYDQLPAEYSVRADLPQIMFRKLRQQWVDMGYGVPSEQQVAPFASSPTRRCNQQQKKQQGKKQQAQQAQQQDGGSQ